MSHETRLGLLYATAAFLLWGIVPVYWKMLQHVPALEILAHRIVLTIPDPGPILRVGIRCSEN